MLRKMSKKGIIRSVISIILLALALTCVASCGSPEPSPGETSSQNGGDIPTVAIPGKRVAITFDDGPHNVRTKAIVDELTKYGFHATFFVVGNRVDGREYNGSSGLKYAAEAGNEIGIHGYTHSSEHYYDKCDDETYRWELSETEKAIKNVINGYSVRLMRPVGGRITEERIKTSKYSIIMWSVDSEDWMYRYSSGDTDAEAKAKVDAIVNNVMSSVQDGSIILMHDIYESTYDALVIILQRLHAEGYQVVTVSELIGSDLAAGREYSSGK